MLVPFERVRTATAPSKVIRLSGVREPLIFKPPVVKPKLNCAKAPPLTPGFNNARNSGFRPLSGIIRISLVVISLPSVAVSDWMVGASATR
jgi:hypothetical protein